MTTNMAASDSDTDNSPSIYEELSAAEKETPSEDPLRVPTEAKDNISSRSMPMHPNKSESAKLPSRYRHLVRTIRIRQATFLGHVIRRGKLEHLVTTGKFEGKRGRGRQRERIMDGLATWLGPGKVSDILAAAKDRDLWRDMIANAYKQGT
ncbi:hypothetical protein PoB_006533700 [Plakobranchus ocellatus]|uniref:Uncharacterized protein n=1 Tax=Plakobranchus ocellatus TaxID=259542 RepID=A0AAV4D3S3_9GAST|nr:hypothetical protein PoB_006533700 [Plakobranchus ocellatus]